MAFLEVDNSWMFYNQGTGRYATAQSLTSGQSNTLSTNTVHDVAVADDSLVKKIASSVFNLGSPNNVMNSDGSRIEPTTGSISTCLSPAPTEVPTPHPAQVD